MRDVSFAVRWSLALFSATLVAGWSLPALAGPALSVVDGDDWRAAPISPLVDTEWYTYDTGDDINFFPGGVYLGFIEPQLYVFDDPLDNEDTGGPGLVMTWGDTSSSECTGAWKYEYGLDPDLTGHTITVSVMPPAYPFGGHITSTGIALVDADGDIRSWAWLCADVANPVGHQIATGEMWQLSTGVIGSAPVMPGMAVGSADVASLVHNNPDFDPETVVRILFMVSGNTTLPYPEPGDPLIAPSALWSWWGNLAVTGNIPEPGVGALLALGAVLAIARSGPVRRASSKPHFSVREGQE